MKISIGICTFDDYDGVYFTIQSLLLYHSSPNYTFEFIVIDNNPSSEHGKETKKFVESFVKGIYIPYTEKQSSFNKYKTIDYATGDIFLGLDGHVLLAPNAIDSLVQFFKENPDSIDLIQGPLLLDDLKHQYTHFTPKWSGDMYGVWACADKETLDKNIPFEIELQGMGLYAFRTSAWKGINPNFIGFGGEEGYIQGKFKQWGGKTICLPSLQWVHRFGRPNGVKYNLILEDRIWNYFLGCMDMHNEPLHPFMSSIYDYFKTRVTKQKLDSILQKVIMHFK